MAVQARLFDQNWSSGIFDFSSIIKNPVASVDNPFVGGDLAVKHRPTSIILVSALYSLSGLVLLGLTLFWADWDFTTWTRTIGFSKVVLILGTWTVAAGIWRVRPWGYFLFLVFSSLLVGASVYKYATEPIATHYYGLVALVLVAGSTAMLVKRHVMAPYFNPKIRWWETSERVRGSLRTEVASSIGTFSAEVLDLSITGCFVMTSAGLKSGDILFVKFDHFGIRIFVMTKVVRQVDDKHKGYGLMFLDLSREERRLIERMMGFMVENRSMATPFYGSTFESDSEAAATEGEISADEKADVEKSHDRVRAVS